MNLYGYGDGDPINNSDPFGLCPVGGWRGFTCNSIEAISTFAGSIVGFSAGGGGGALLAVATGGAAAPAVPGAAYAGAVAGAAVGLSVGQSITNRLFSEAAEGSTGGGGGKASGLRRQLSEHEQKLADYIANPDAHDNKGFLKNATPAQRERIINGRVRNLQGQINNFKKLIDQAEGVQP